MHDERTRDGGGRREDAALPGSTDVSGAPGQAGIRVLLRLSGEVSTKSRRTRSRFQKRLAGNLRDALESEGVDARVENAWSRLYVTATDAGALEPLGRVFGISSYSALEAECAAGLDEIVEVGRRLYADRVTGRRYAVRARRSGRHPFGSHDVMDRLGAALNPGATVDLDDPEVEVRVEVRDDRAYLFSERRPGAGGLPIGVEGRAVALLSGGFDSAVAAWMTLRRGIELDYVFCNLGGAAYRRMVLEVAKVLADRWSYGSRPRIHVLDFTEVVEEMRRSARSPYLQVVLKRLMYRAGTAVAAETGAEALVTGEAMGQVSSQTLSNLRAIEGASNLPVLRPLIGFDKEEIIARSRRIGTYELSARVREYCSVAPGRPVTASSPEAAAEQEAAVEAEVLRAAIAGREALDLRRLEATDIVGESLFVAEIAEDAEVVDTRDPAAYGSWHWPGAVRRDYEELSREFGNLDREKIYVLYCGEGIRTAYLAERMQARGYEAYSFRGGVRGLRRYARERAVDPGDGPSGRAGTAPTPGLRTSRA